LCGGLPVNLQFSVAHRDREKEPSVGRLLFFLGEVRLSAARRLPELLACVLGSSQQIFVRFSQDAAATSDYSSYMAHREKEQPELEKAAYRWMYATVGLSVSWLVWLGVILWKWP